MKFYASDTAKTEHSSHMGFLWGPQLYHIPVRSPCRDSAALVGAPVRPTSDISKFHEFREFHEIHEIHESAKPLKYFKNGVIVRTQTS